MKKFLIISAIICFSFSIVNDGNYIFAQNGINSPFSRYGFGSLSDRSMGFNKGMAGISQGIRDKQIINMANPAAYSEVDSITALFDFGLSIQNGNYHLDNMRYNAKNSSINYLAFHFRATRNVGIAFGVLPFTNINYNFATESQPTDGSTSITNTSTYVGSGGLHQIMLGTGWRFIKNASIGFNISYLFGNYSHSVTTSFSDNTIYSSYKSSSADINTYTLNVGAQYWINLNKKDKLTLGFTYGLGHNINNDEKNITSIVRSSDSSLDTTIVSNAFQYPHTFAVGVAYNHTYKWLAGMDFELQKWSKCRFPNAKGTISASSGIAATNNLNDQIRISVGGAYRPSLVSDNLFQKMQYKIGVYYAQCYANADYTHTISDKPHEFGLSAGVSIPLNTRHLYIKNNIPVLHLTGQWVYSNIPYIDNVLQAKKTLTENYLKFSIGLTFSERWFNKWKFQ